MAFTNYKINKEKFQENRTLNFKRALAQKLMTGFCKKQINQKFQIDVDKEIQESLKNKEKSLQQESGGLNQKM